MFNETHSSSYSDGLKLTFIKSPNIFVYPCGRRRSFVEDPDKNTNTIEDQYYIPFDPEARLNTEANNRRHSSLNGFTQTYIKDAEWNKESFVLSLDGYLFRIVFDDEMELNTFGTELLEQLSETVSVEDTSIYANILIEDTPIFSDKFTYYTGVLRNQSETNEGATSVDIVTTALANNKNSTQKDFEDKENYYFSGLSFSIAPLTSVIDSEINVKDTISTAVISSGDAGSRSKRVVSLRVFDITGINEVQLEGTTKKEYELALYLPACLPKVTHGNSPNSAKIDTLIVNKIEKNGIAVPSLEVKQIGTTYQLQFKRNKS